MSKILVTGGCGYIGSHTIVDLIENGYDVISVDDNSRSTARILEGIEKITGKKVKNYKVDLCDFDDTYAILGDTGAVHGSASTGSVNFAPSVGYKLDTRGLQEGVVALYVTNQNNISFSNQVLLIKVFFSA